MLMNCEIIIYRSKKLFYLVPKQEVIREGRAILTLPSFQMYFLAIDSKIDGGLYHIDERLIAG